MRCDAITFYVGEARMLAADVTDEINVDRCFHVHLWHII